jgi:hypothetical protein
MHDTITAVLVTLCVFIGGVAGLLLYPRLPDHHRTTETRDVVRLAIGMISVLASLVLGLLTASAKRTFDTVDGDLRAYASNLIMLDRTLRDYGAAADPIRAALREYTERAVNTTWPDLMPIEQQQLEDPHAGALLDSVVKSIGALSPVGDDQRMLRSQAMTTASQLVHTRWDLLLGQNGTISPIMLGIMVAWITVIFMSFGLFAPRNGTVLVALMICSMSIGTSIFLILEMDTPFDGVIMVSGNAMKSALDHLKQ